MTVSHRMQVCAGLTFQLVFAACVSQLQADATLQGRLLDKFGTNLSHKCVCVGVSGSGPALAADSFVKQLTCCQGNRSAAAHPVALTSINEPFLFPALLLFLEVFFVVVVVFYLWPF